VAATSPFFSPRSLRLTTKDNRQTVLRDALEPRSFQTEPEAYMQLQAREIGSPCMLGLTWAPHFEGYRPHLLNLFAAFGWV